MLKLDLHSLWKIMYYNYLVRDSDGVEGRLLAYESVLDAKYEVFSNTIAIITLDEVTCYFVAEKGYIKSSEEIPYNLTNNK